MAEEGGHWYFAEVQESVPAKSQKCRIAWYGEDKDVSCPLGKVRHVMEVKDVVEKGDVIDVFYQDKYWKAKVRSINQLQ